MTEILRGVLGEDYNFDSTVRALQLLFSHECLKLTLPIRIHSVHCIDRSQNAASLKTMATLCSIRTNMVKHNGSLAIVLCNF